MTTMASWNGLRIRVYILDEPYRRTHVTPAWPQKRLYRFNGSTVSLTATDILLRHLEMEK